jgi:hypothetical protein
MAEYKGIHGTKIQNYTTDPDNPITGQVWYNETDQVMKFQYPTTIDAWSTGGNLNTARYLGASMVDLLSQQFQQQQNHMMELAGQK